MARGEELNFIQKRFLVQRLACFEKPTAVAKAFKEEFGFELQLNRVTYYDPTTKAGAALADELKEIFFSTRKANLADVESVKISHKAHQLRALDRALDIAESRNAIPMVISLVEAAAKIAGTIVSKHEHTGKDGKDLPAPTAVTIVTTDPNEAAKIYQRMLSGE